jgi:hypothetical protein
MHVEGGDSNVLVAVFTLFLLHTAPCWESAELPLKAISSVELLETYNVQAVSLQRHIAQGEEFCQLRQPYVLATTQNRGKKKLLGEG